MATITTLLKIGADISDMQAGMAKVVAHLDKLDDSAKKTAEAMTMTEKAAGFLKSNFSQFTAANLAANAIQSVTAEVQRFVAEGAQLSGLRTSFERLSGGIKQNSADMMQALRTGTRGMVSDFELMKAANKAMLLGLPVTAESMGELSKAAVVLGKAMGQDATKSVDDLITALGRSSPMILDNLGLSVKVGEANEAYAKSLGKTAEQLTDAEKKMAFFVAANRAAQAAVKELGEQTKTLGDIATTVWTKFGNVVSATSSAVNVGLGRAATSGAGFIQFLQNSITYGVGSAVVMSDLSQQIENHSTKVKENVHLGEEAAKGANDFASMAKRLRTEIAQLTPAQVENIKAGKEMGKTNKEIVEALSKVGGAVKVTEAHLNLYELSTKNATKATKDHDKTLKALLTPLHAAGDGVGNLTHAWSELSKVNVEAMKRQTELEMSMRQQLPLYANWYQQLMRVRDGMATMIPTLGAMNDKLADQQRHIRGVIEQATANLEQAAQEKMSRVAAIGGGLIDAIAHGIETGDWSGIVQGIQQGVGTSIAMGIDALVPGLGTLLKPITDALTGKLFGLFGKGKGRTMVEDWVKETFGTFRNLQDKLVALGQEEYDRLWKMLNTVGRNNIDQAEAAIKAVADALEAQKQKATEAAAVVAMRNTALIDAQISNVNRLTSEYNRLWDSIKDEAPEDVMGIVETNTRARMEAVAKEREHAVDQLKELTDSLSMGFDEVLKKLDKFIERLGSIPPIHIPISTTSGTEPPDPEGFARGSGGIRDFGAGTLAVLHGREGVFTEPQVNALRGRSGPSQITIPISVGGRHVETVVVDVLNSVVRRRQMQNAA